jgi:hypothetical protein
MAIPAVGERVRTAVFTRFSSSLFSMGWTIFLFLLQKNNIKLASPARQPSTKYLMTPVKEKHTWFQK